MVTDRLGLWTAVVRRDERPALPVRRRGSVLISGDRRGVPGQVETTAHQA